MLFSSVDILRQRTHDIEVKKYCISLLEKLGSFQYTRKVLEALDVEARAEVGLKSLSLYPLKSCLSMVVSSSVLGGSFRRKSPYGSTSQ